MADYNGLTINISGSMDSAWVYGKQVYSKFVGASSNTLLYINRVYDTIKGDFVLWTTFGPDIEGVNYPGPGIFQTQTNNYINFAL